VISTKFGDNAHINKVENPRTELTLISKYLRNIKSIKVIGDIYSYLRRIL
jgi:hypothetical protein